MSTTPSGPIITSVSRPLSTSTTLVPDGEDVTSFKAPAYTAYPPFYTLQPNLTTRARQLELWSSLVLSYCSHHRVFRLSLSSLPANLFANNSIRRALKSADIRTVLDYMSKAENGGRTEWIPTTVRGEQSNSCWVYWRALSEWADAIYGWVDETGQKGAVLTVYELREGEAVTQKEWREADEAFLRKILAVLVRRGKAQIFGQEENAGVKFF